MYLTYLKIFMLLGCAIDGCHIPNKCPPGGKNACKEYHNYKNFFSVVLMASLTLIIVLFGLAVDSQIIRTIP
jgi:hypothetical protein